MEFAQATTAGRDVVVPVQPGLLTTGDVVWNLIFTNGIAWDEAGGVDDCWSRASVPFALSERNANCIQVPHLLTMHTTVALDHLI